MNLHAALGTLLYALLVLWLSAGFADWLCHRATHIERTSGPRESSLHLLLIALVAAPVIAGLYLEITAPVLAFMLTCALAHQACSLWDTAYSQPRRHISPPEQMVHGFLDQLPLFALVIVALLHADALHEPRWEISARLQAPPFRTLILAAFAASALLILEEWQRGHRARG